MGTEPRQASASAASQQSPYPDVSREMITAGVAYFHDASEDRFPSGWPLAELFVVGLYRAMRVAAETRPVAPPDRCSAGGEPSPAL